MLDDYLISPIYYDVPSGLVNSQEFEIVNNVLLIENRFFSKNLIDFNTVKSDKITLEQLKHYIDKNANISNIDYVMKSKPDFYESNFNYDMFS